MSKKLNMYGVDFELCGTSTRLPQTISTIGIRDVYGRPSDYKVSIWDSWARWFVNEARSVKFGVCSHSCNFFSIEGMIDFEGKRYYLRITKAHNRAYEVVNPVCD